MTSLMTPAQVSEQLQVKEATLAQWRWRKTGPEFVRVGRFIRYTQAALDDWLANGGKVV